ncbi:MAG: DUF4202 family protein [Acidimicrobiales bacterium]
MQKIGLATDPEVQTFEDAVSLTFVETQFTSTADKIADDTRMVEVVAKTLRKMTPAGQAAAASIEPDDRSAGIVAWRWLRSGHDRPVFRTDFDPRHGEMVQVSPLLRRLVANSVEVHLPRHGHVCDRPRRRRGGRSRPARPGPRRRAARGARRGTDPPRADHPHPRRPLPAALLRPRRAGPTCSGSDPTRRRRRARATTVTMTRTTTMTRTAPRAIPSRPAPEELRRAAEDVEKHRPDVDFAPDERLSDGSVVEGPGWTVEALHTPGHISNHLCFAAGGAGGPVRRPRDGMVEHVIPPPTATWPHTSVARAAARAHRPGPVSDAWRTGRRSPALRAVAARPPPLTRAPDPGTARSGPASARETSPCSTPRCPRAPPSGRPVGGGPSAQALDEGHAAPVIRDESTVSSRVVWELT